MAPAARCTLHAAHRRAPTSSLHSRRTPDTLPTPHPRPCTTLLPRAGEHQPHEAAAGPGGGPGAAGRAGGAGGGRGAGRRRRRRPCSAAGGLWRGCSAACIPAYSLTTVLRPRQARACADGPDVLPACPCGCRAPAASGATPPAWRSWRRAAGWRCNRAACGCTAPTSSSAPSRTGGAERAREGGGSGGTAGCGDNYLAWSCMVAM